VKPRDAKRLMVGDRVIWQGDKNDTGEVVEAGYCAVKITWDNGQVGVLHHNDMKDVSRP
jgi:hypothetical protein